MVGVCCCGRWTSARGSSASSPPALPTIAIRNGSDAWVGPSFLTRTDYEASLGWSAIFMESEMALLSECMESYVQKTFDTDRHCQRGDITSTAIAVFQADTAYVLPFSMLAHLLLIQPLVLSSVPGCICGVLGEVFGQSDQLLFTL